MTSEEEDSSLVPAASASYSATLPLQLRGEERRTSSYIRRRLSERESEEQRSNRRVEGEEIEED